MKKEWQAVLVKGVNGQTIFKRVAGEKADVFQGILNSISEGFKLFSRPGLNRSGAWTTNRCLSDRLAGETK